MKVGDIVDVEIAGECIGDAVVSEITDEYMEVVYMGRAFKLSPNVLQFFEIKRDLENWGI